MIRSVVKRAVDSCFPGIGLTYRTLREGRVPGPALETPFGFKLAGSVPMATGQFESEEIACFLRYLPTVAACIDVGANIGLYACLAASHRKHVIAVEPLASNLRTLLDNLVCNNFLNVEVYPIGLSGTPAIARLYGGGTGASFLRGWAGTSESWNRIVSLSTLDILTGTRFDGMSLLIKLDVEGSELDVLRGSERTMTMNPKPIWLVEICLNEHFPSGFNENFFETFEMFWRRGYQCKTTCPNARIVEPGDVKRWVRSGSVDFGTHNYLFEPA